MVSIYSSTFSLLVSSFWALVFWSLSFFLRAKVLVDSNSWFTIYSSTFPLLISSLWALVFWSLSFPIRVIVLLNTNSWFTIYSSTFPLLISSLWALVFWSLSFLTRVKGYFKHQNKTLVGATVMENSMTATFTTFWSLALVVWVPPPHH